MTEFDPLFKSEYLVGTRLVGKDSSKLNESAIVIKSSLITEWWGKDRSHILSLILKLPVMMRRFEIFTSVSLRYFKAECKESE